jgi:NarL family two-component system sensor histidine kinase LiaS
MLSLAESRTENSELRSRGDSLPSGFTGRIDRRLSLVYISLFILVFSLGGVSLYLLASHLIKSAAISRQSEQIHIIEQIDRRLQDFTSRIQLAHLQGAAVPVPFIESSSRDFESFLTRYRNAGGSAGHIQELQQMIADAEHIAAAIRNESRQGNIGINTHDLAAMETVQQHIQAFTEGVTEEHERVEDQLASETHHKMKIIFGFNIALLLIGTVFLIALRKYFNYAIAAPLRKLAERSSRIAKGEFPESMPIASKDEIGLLSHSFNDMAERLKEHQEKLKGLAILEERERLACELHDSLAQDLACIRLKLIEADKRVGASETGAVQELTRELFTMVDEAYQDLRESIFGLRALKLRKEIGVVNALTEFLRDFTEVRKLPVELHVTNPQAIQFAPQVEIQFIRILHEALTNMVKHARATRGKIKITTDECCATIIIEDDGRGFYPETFSEASLRFGLKTMNDRARSVGADLQLDSAPGRGTKLTLRLPLVKANYHEAHPPIIG